MKTYLKEFNKLLAITSILRSKKGCLWDMQQTHFSILKNLFSEANEVKQAIEKNDMNNLQEELGDILFQVVFHCQIAKENNDFDITKVIKILNNKLIFRHPHVFSDRKANNINDVEKIWIKHKNMEKKIKKKEKKILI
ncbi:MAG: hypothetical protein LBL53_00720 [Endomicrobium sp.]|jgi:tetrapyrrole methylase family protein/MazG family protein|nr:hypothetical protein [Endomicrobium sp.]